MERRTLLYGCLAIVASIWAGRGYKQTEKFPPNDQAPPQTPGPPIRPMTDQETQDHLNNLAFFAALGSSDSEKDNQLKAEYQEAKKKLRKKP